MLIPILTPPTSNDLTSTARTGGIAFADTEISAEDKATKYKGCCRRVFIFPLIIAMNYGYNLHSQNLLCN